MPTTSTNPVADEETPLLRDGTKQARSGSEGDYDFDARFKKWKAAVAQKFRRSASQDARPVLLVTFFDDVDAAQSVLDRKQVEKSALASPDATVMTASQFQLQVQDVRKAIAQGIHPKMIAAGSSGSYFVRVLSPSTTNASTHETQSPATNIVAVFKPKDEEPYGNLNPKRQFLRKYFWWAMGRPCLIPNFSYLSEVGASYLDSRLCLQMVPRTELVELSSPSFHYAFSDRKLFDTECRPLPAKIGSYQTFLKGYVNASDFLRKHPWPSRSRSEALMLRDFEDESRAHHVSRKKQNARLRNCGIAFKRFLLCRPSPSELAAQDDQDDLERQQRQNDHDDVLTSSPDGFYWTPKRMEQFRLQLEKLVVLDYLMRNTDRGLDNFMVKHDKVADSVMIGAIDNSLSFPIKHPNEIRQYPFGWLFLPTDLIGLPFSEETRRHLLPILNDPVWWQQTVQGLRQVFQRDPYFDEGKFKKQMSVLRGQGWNLVQSLRNEEEGPLDLCAREKKFIRQDVVDVPTDDLHVVDGARVPIDFQGQILVDRLHPLDQAAFKSTGSKQAKTSSFHTQQSTVDGHSTTRPIGARASLSYRQALLQASGSASVAEPSEPIAWVVSPNTKPVQDVLPQSLPGPSFMQDAFAGGKMVVQTSSAASKNAQRPSRHSRMSSAIEPGSFLRRQGSDTTAYGDDILGQTGMQVLENLDRERKQKNKLNLFKSPRPRSSTVSTGCSGPYPDSVEHHDVANTSDAVDAVDLASSIMSDPGHRPGTGPGEAQRPGKARQPRRVSRHSSRMSSSTHDLYREEDVLSEEEEQHENDDRLRRSQANSSNVVESGPSIETVLSSAQRLSQSNGSANSPAEGSTRFTPHIPHANAIGSVNNISPDDASPTELLRKNVPNKSTVKVILETMSSETRQPWLKWI